MKKALFLFWAIFLVSCASMPDNQTKPERSVASEQCKEDRYFVNSNNYFEDYERCKDL